MAELLAGAAEAGFLAGVPLGRWYPELDDCFLVAVTEKRTEAEIDGLAECLSHGRTSHAKSHDHAIAVRAVPARPPRVRLPACDVPVRPLEELLPPEAVGRRRRRRLPELAEPDVVRHFTNLSTLNMSVDTHFYPLGSCTMKYNPKRNERLAALPGFVDVHPYQPDETIQGLLQLLYELQQMLAEISGLPAVSLQPAAGAHGELTALMVAAAYFRDRGRQRTQGARARQRPRHQPGQRRGWPASRRSRSAARRPATSIWTTCAPSWTTRSPCS